VCVCVCVCVRACVRACMDWVLWSEWILSRDRLYTLDAYPNLSILDIALYKTPPTFFCVTGQLSELELSECRKSRPDNTTSTPVSERVMPLCHSLWGIHKNHYAKKKIMCVLEACVCVCVCVCVCLCEWDVCVFMCLQIFVFVYAFFSS
jgi:hypothetical protein